jgi:hypothetical protein
MQNIVILAGNIGQAPETRTTQGGTKITHFTLATSRPRLLGRPRDPRRERLPGPWTPNGTASPASTASARRSPSTARRA